MHLSREQLLRQLAGLNASDDAQGWPVISRTRPTLSDGDIPFFGHVIRETRDVNGTPTHYFNIVRTAGWAVTVGITTDNHAIILTQWKPGMNMWGLELPPGGIGRITPGMTTNDIQVRTAQVLQRETGFGEGAWERLPSILIESGKYRGSTVDGKGLVAHLFLATGLRPVTERVHAANERIRVNTISLTDLLDMVLNGNIVEESAVAAIFHAAFRLGLAKAA